MKVGYIIAIALSAFVSLSVQGQAYTGKYGGWEISDCRRPHTGECAEDFTCCNEKKGIKEHNKKCLGPGECDPSKDNYKEKECILKCEFADVSEWETDGLCHRPETGPCSESGACCDEVKGLRIKTRTCLGAACDPKDALRSESECKIKCEKVKIIYDDVSQWATDGLCHRPETGPCTERGTCCDEVKGLRIKTRTCLGENCKPDDNLRSESECKIKCSFDDVSQWATDGLCHRPETGPCAASDACCGEIKGKRIKTRTCLGDFCHPDDTFRSESDCKLTCEKTYWDELSPFTTDNVCRRPETGPCSEKYSCCNEKLGTKMFTRTCLGENCDPEKPLSRTQECLIKCEKKIECINTLKDERAFVTRTCDPGFGDLSLAGTTCQYTCPDGFKVFPFDETTCGIIPEKPHKATWTPKRSPCCVPNKCTTYEQLDILILLDTSQSIGQKWPKMQQFVKQLLGGGYFKIGPNDVRVAIAQFNRFVYTESEFFLKDTTTKAALMDHIDSLTCCELKTNIGYGLGHMYKHHFSMAAGNRRGVPNVLITITDGATTDGLPLLRIESEKNSHRAVMWAVKIGDKAKNAKQATSIERALTIIAGPDTPSNRVTIKDFEELANAVKDLSVDILDSTCLACANEEDRAEWSSWSKGECDSQCGEGTVTYTRTCDGIGECEEGDSEMFAPCEDLPQCAEWTEWVGQGCNDECGEGSVQTFTRECVGFGSCPGDATKQEACEGVPSCAEWTEWKGGECNVECGKGVVTYTRTCEGFPENGCPGDAEKEEECEKDPCVTCDMTKVPFKGEATCQAADSSVLTGASHPQGTKCTFTCGEGLVVTPATSEVLTCQSDESWDQPAPCCKPAECKVTEYMDLVIIVDRSKSARDPDWSLTKEFLIKFLSRSLYIGADKVRVSIVPFAKTPDQDQIIKLKDTDGQAGLLNKIRAMTCCEGGTFTPTAMLHAANEMLTEENGERPDAPNLILVITDGKSTEGKKQLRKQGFTLVQQEEGALKKVKEAAAHLRSKGTVFAVGIGVAQSVYGKKTVEAIAGPDFPNNQEIFPNSRALNALANKIEKSVIDAACDVCVAPEE